MSKPYTLEYLAALLKRARTVRRLSQTELAKKAGIGQAHLSRIEQGKVDLRASSLIEVARILGFELMLVPKEYVPAVSALINAARQNTAAETPAYELRDDEDEDLYL